MRVAAVPLQLAGNETQRQVDHASLFVWLVSSAILAGSSARPLETGPFRYIEGEGLAATSADPTPSTCRGSRDERAASAMAKHRKKKREKKPGSLLSRVRRSLSGDSAEGTSSATRSAKPHAPLPDLVLSMADDDMEAVVRTIYPDTTQDQLTTLLARWRVSFGVDRKAIQRILKAASDDGRPRHHVVVARGRDPGHPAPPQLNYQLPPGLGSTPDLEPLRRRLSAPVREQLLGSLPASPVWAASPGDQLGAVCWDPGECGYTVRGEEIPPLPRRRDDRAHLALLAGPGVQLSSDTSEYRAEWWGYVSLSEDRLSVLRPLWVPVDGSGAYFLYLPWSEGCRGPTAADLASVLESAGVCEGVDEGALGALGEQLSREPAGDPLHLLASARQSTPCQDADVRFSFRYEPGAGRVRADGSIDFRERSVFPSVNQADLLVECRLAIPGQEGLSVRGETIPVLGPRRARLDCGANVRLEESEGLQRLYTEIDGGAIVRTDEITDEEGPITRYTVAVEPVTTIPGDVDLQTGNIDVPGNVIVSGSVTAGLRVTAGGDVAVSGSVEAGAQISVGGNITVQQGIVGDTTHIDAGGGITAKFAQDATLEAGSDIILGSYARGAQLSTFGRLQVDGSGGSGGIAGGRAWALQGMRVRSLGAAGSTGTEVLVGPQPDGSAKLEKLRKALGRVDDVLVRLLQSMNMEAFDSQVIRELIATTDDQATRRCAHQADQLATTRDRLSRQVQSLEEVLQQDWTATTVEVPDVAYAGTVVRLGDQQTLLSEDVKTMRLTVGG